MNKKPAYLTINGRPLCTCGDYLMHEYRITCGHRSLADARRAKAELQKHRSGVRVVPGRCPDSLPID
jgi:hypothetical protein